jgi:hypothetical protein
LELLLSSVLIQEIDLKNVLHIVNWPDRTPGHVPAKEMLAHRLATLAKCWTCARSSGRSGHTEKVMLGSWSSMQATLQRHAAESEEAKVKLLPRELEDVEHLSTIRHLSAYIVNELGAQHIHHRLAALQQNSETAGETGGGEQGPGDQGPRRRPRRMTTSSTPPPTRVTGLGRRRRLGLPSPGQD